jgi:hypothetical protein
MTTETKPETRTMSEQDLRIAIERGRRLLNAALADATGKAEADRVRAVRVSTDQVGALGRAKDEDLAKLRTRREQQRRDAAKAQDLALRAAKGDYDRTMHRIDKDFDAARDAYNAAFTANVAPIDAAHREQLGAIEATLEAQVAALEAEHETAAEPLVEQLKAITEAQAERVAQAAAIAALAAPEPPSTTAVTP